MWAVADLCATLRKGFLSPSLSGLIWRVGRRPAGVESARQRECTGLARSPGPMEGWTARPGPRGGDRCAEAPENAQDTGGCLRSSRYRTQRSAFADITPRTWRKLSQDSGPRFLRTRVTGAPARSLVLFGRGAPSRVAPATSSRASPGPARGHRRCALLQQRRRNTFLAPRPRTETVHPLVSVRRGS